MKVLFVDDSVDNLALYKLYFKKLTEVEIEYYSKPSEGLAQSLNDTYDLIFLDIQMPEVDGFEFKKIIDEANINAVICALTGFTDEKTLEKLESFNFHEVVKKPVLKQDLIDLIEKYKK